jgi:thioredoxin 1
MAQVKLIDFWAVWCGPCRIMEPIIDELKEEFSDKIEIEKVNVDEKPELASKFGVMSIPTFVVLKDDKEVGRKIGVTSKAELQKLLES